MTIPRIQGWWDEIEEDVTKLAETTARIIDPLIDNKRALGQMLRQDPTKQQALADLELNNPGLLEQLYGPGIAQQIKVAKPSTGALKEAAGRRLADTPAGDIKNPTVIEAGAIRELGAPSALDIEEQKLGIESGQQTLDYYKWKFDQDKWRAAMENPEIAARYEANQKARQQYPELALLDPYDMAKEWLEGTLDEAKIRALASRTPEGYEMFKVAVQDLGQWARMERGIEEDNNRFYANLANDPAERQLQAFVRQTVLKTGLPYQAVYKHFKGEALVPEVQKMLDDDERVRQQKERLGNMAKIQPAMKSFLEAEGKDKDIQKDNLEMILRDIFNAPIQIKSIKTGFWSKESRFLLNGVSEVDGELLYELASNPDAYQNIVAEDTVLNNLTSLEAVNGAIINTEAALKATQDPEQKRDLSRFLGKLQKKVREFNRGRR